MQACRRRIFGLAIAFAFPFSQTAEAAQLERIRLLPPVLVKGETGWSLEERMRHYKVEAVSVAVVKDFQVARAEAFGLADREERVPATAQTLFQAGSISKPVAAAGILRRVEKGELALDRDVNEYLKSWKLPENQLTATKKVTLERLLSHTAGTTVHGFPGYAVGEAVPTVPQILDGAPPANTAPVRVTIEPGTKFEYSGGGITIAQLVQTDTTGRAFPDLLAELVLRPAGMSHSTYEQPLPADKLRLAAAGYRGDGSLLPGKRHTYPEMAAAGLWTTAEDLARFGAAIARSLRGDAGSLLSKRMAERMTTPVLSEVGLGFFIQTLRGETYFGHDGSDEGFQAILIMNRDKGYGAAVMANSDRGIELGQEIVRGIAREDDWAGFLPEPVTIAKLPAADMQALAGGYGLNAIEGFRLFAQGGRLIGKPSFGEEFELLPISRDAFIRKDRQTRYQIERSKGMVKGITVVSDGEHNVERKLARRLASGERLPAELLAEGDYDAAKAAYRKALQEHPDDAGVAESRLNQVGYWLAMHGDLAQAIAVLKLNTELRPTSSNTYDSLAEIYLKSGDRARAVENYRRVLEVLPTDTKTDAHLKQQLRNNAEAKVKELER